VSDAEDLDALVIELNAVAPRAASAGEHTARLQGWLEQVVARSAADLLLVAGAPPSLRIDGAIVALGSEFGGPLGSEEIEDAIEPALPPHARRAYRDVGIADSSFRVEHLGRFRINLHHERGRAAARPRQYGGSRKPCRASRRSICRHRWRR
jgi:twitching motility protein PilT